MAEALDAIRGKVEVPKRLNHAAVLVVDMQNDIVHPDGWFTKNGIDVSRNRAIVPNIKKLINGARQKSIPIIYCKAQFRKDLIGAGLLPTLRPIYVKGGFRVGTWGAEIVDELAPTEPDLVICKTQYSGFVGTNLEALLHEMAIETVLVTGTATNSCCEATAKDAFQRGFSVVLVKDCTATPLGDEFQKMAEKAIEFGYGFVLSVDEVLRLI